ncbi:ABC transporter ATP-binding protein [Phytoactinopolyspora halotolerans]|uniref:Fatty acid ABC transporter ATP-binding/permease protein n=1 Tax=Phytoactinopolyspora halotolerans TaxID=1981512 RepID=A0A6L9S6Y0_9ACTN|nr:ABC transporter ATP-binding protein [Phytoactinopolyspora halotolerans]NEE00767.1 ABC transporter ATP-binding protein [Phytoactinopolyspora halotolerans]
MSTTRTDAAGTSGGSARGPVAGRGPGGGGPGGFGGMGAPPQKPMNFGPSARRLLGRLRPERRGVLLVLVLGVVSVALNVSGPRILGHATDLIFSGAIGHRLPEGVSKQEAIEQARARGDDTFADMLGGMDVIPGQGIDFDALRWVLLGVLALYLGASLFAWLQAYLLNEVVQRTMYRLREDVETKLNRLPLRHFDTSPRGDVLSRVTNDIDNISQSMTQTMSQLLSSVLSVLGVLVMMVIISPVLAIIALVTVPLSVVVTALIAKRSQKQFVAQWSHTGGLNAQVEEAYTGHALVKVFGRQHEVEQAFAEKNEQLYEAGFKAQFISGMIRPIMMFIGSLNYVAIAVVGGLRVASGSMSLGEVQAFIQYSQQFTQPLTQLAAMVNLLQSGVASAERVFEFLDAQEQEPDAARPVRVADARGRVEFEDVWFSYDPDEPLIEGLSLVAEPGTTVAIVGPTGAGKTTLVNLIMRFYELRAGRILLDGVDITEVSRAQLRARIAMVLQDSWLFGGTIAENIAYGDPDASQEQVLAAARAAYVDRFVHSLPDGYDTVIDEEGDNLSAGEKQLITIARAFLAGREILILDEATSSVDTRTEVLVQQAMADLRASRTSFVIAHRLSTIRDADVIVVMEHGRIVEQGSHTELLAAHGAYHRLYTSQFTAPAVEAP